MQVKISLYLPWFLAPEFIFICITTTSQHLQCSGLQGSLLCPWQSALHFLVPRLPLYPAPTRQWAFGFLYPIELQKSKPFSSWSSQAYSDELHSQWSLGPTIIFKAAEGCLGGSVLGHLPSAQVMISGSWNGDPCWAPCSVGSLLLPLPLPLPPLMLALSLSLRKQKN